MGKELVGGVEDAVASTPPKLRTSGSGCAQVQEAGCEQNCLFCEVDAEAEVGTTFNV
jgi:hypothetical protein